RGDAARGLARPGRHPGRRGRGGGGGRRARRAGARAPARRVRAEPAPLAPPPHPAAHPPASRQPGGERTVIGMIRRAANPLPAPTTSRDRRYRMSDDKTIRLTADVVALAPDADGLEHVLLIRRRWEPYADHWALPGGHVDTGEAVRTAAARELAEETGLDIDDDALIELGAWHAPGRDPRGRYVTVAYRADLPHRATATAADDAADAQWWPVDALDDLVLAFDHRRIITRALASRYSARSTARGTVGVQAAVVADTTVVQTWTR